MKDCDVRAILDGVLPGTYLVIKYMPKWFEGNTWTTIKEGYFEGLKYHLDGTLSGVKLEGQEKISGRGIVEIHRHPAKSAHRKIKLEDGQEVDIFIDYKK